MDSNKKPRAPEEEERGVQKIQLEQLDERFRCEIDGIPIQNIKSYSCVQSSTRNQCGSCVNHDKSSEEIELVSQECFSMVSEKRDNNPF